MSKPDDSATDVKPVASPRQETDADRPTTPSAPASNTDGVDNTMMPNDNNNMDPAMMMNMMNMMGMMGGMNGMMGGMNPMMALQAQAAQVSLFC